jgi:hypothetical protein
VAAPKPAAARVRPAAPPLAPARREHLRPVPDLPRVPAPDLPRVPAREEPLMPVAAGPARSWQERGRRRLHQVVRFDRRIEVAAEQRRPDERRPDDPQPVRELKRGLRKHHVVVRFQPPQGHQFGQRPESASEWQLYDQAEA